MKVVHVIFTLQYGGAETLLVDIVNKQVKNDNITIFVINDDYSETLLNTIDKRVNLVLFKRKKGGFDFVVWLKILSKFIEINPDVIHSHDSKAIYFIPFWCYKTVLTVHAMNLSLKGVGLYSSVVAISNAVKDDLYARKGIQSEVIYNGIDIGLIQEKETLRHRQSFKMIQVGRLVHQIKGQDILLKALSVLKERKCSFTFSLDFVGEGTSFDYLSDLVQSYNLSDCVRFLGVKDRAYIYTHLCEYDLLVQPSFDEGFGLTIIEAMAARIPVLVSDISGPIEVIGNGKLGFFFQKGNEQDCADKILYILGSVQNVSAIVEKASMYCHENFDIENTVDAYSALYVRSFNHK
jgi:glycosyltransferase involved in cell wall biosynthesis